MPIDDAYKIEFRELRKLFNDYLNAPAVTTLEDDPTRRKVLWTFIYGEYAHRDPRKREILKKWQTNKGDWDMVVNEFEFALIECVRMISLTNKLNKRILQHYSKKV
jgi:hypothetical protein